MAQIKISQLTPSANLNKDPAQSMFVTVDLGTESTTRISGYNLGRHLYSNNALIVGEVGLSLTPLPNTLGQLSGTSNNYVQVGLQNKNSNGTSDLIITADTGTDVDSYIDFGMTNSTYNPQVVYNGIGTAIEPLSGYVYVKGVDGVPSGNLVIGTFNPGTETRFLAGGANTANIVAKITTTGLSLQNSGVLKYADGTTQSTNSAPQAYSITIGGIANSAWDKANSANTLAQAGSDRANSAYNKANSANVYAQSSYDKANGAYDKANTANTYASSAFNKANNALANTNPAYLNATLFVANNLSVGANVSANGLIFFTNPFIQDLTAMVQIVASNDGSSTGPTQQGYMMQVTGKDGFPSRIINDAHGDTNSYGLVMQRSSRGSANAPTALLAGNVIARWSGNGYGTTKYTSLGGDARIDMVATQNFTDANKGTEVQIWATSNNANAPLQIASFTGNTATFTGVVAPQKGFIFTPNVYSGDQSALTIDFANDSMVRATLNTSISISTTGYIPGKIVEVWLTNTSTNQNRSITHGVAANNSTVGSTSFTLNAQRSAFLKYFSIGSNLANTFVAISYQ